MPSIGETVLFYTHEQSDLTHSAREAAAIVIGSEPNDILLLKVFEWGRAPYDAKVGPYSGLVKDANGAPVSGLSYWREVGSDCPDFDSDYADAHIPTPEENSEANAIEVRQQAEISAAKPEALVALQAKHEKEWEDFDAKWEAKAKGKGEPAAKPFFGDKPPAKPKPLSL